VAKKITEHKNFQEQAKPFQELAYIFLRNANTVEYEPIAQFAVVMSAKEECVFAQEAKAFAKEECVFAQEAKAFAKEDGAFAQEAMTSAKEDVAFAQEAKTSAQKDRAFVQDAKTSAQEDRAFVQDAKAIKKQGNLFASWGGSVQQTVWAWFCMVSPTSEPGCWKK
jgi:hypothetical protein